MNNICLSNYNFDRYGRCNFGSAATKKAGKRVAEVR